MTVSELIAKLRHMPQDDLVYGYNRNGGLLGEVEIVDRGDVGAGKSDPCVRLLLEWEEI